MDFNLDLNDRKNILTQEKISFKNATIAFTHIGIEKFFAYKDKKIIIFDDGLSPKQIIELVLRKNVENVVQNSLHPLEEKIKLLHQIDQNSEYFFHENFNFLPDNDSFHKIIFDNSTPRQMILNLAFHRLHLDIDANRNSLFKVALEEMLMNAQIDAKNISNSTENKKAHLILERKNKLVAASLIDFYGSLVYSKFLSPIESCLNIGIADSINQNRQRGAGIGGSLIFNAADSILMGCESGLKTRITGIFPVEFSERHQEKLQKSLVLI